MLEHPEFEYSLIRQLRKDPPNFILAPFVYTNFEFINEHLRNFGLDDIFPTNSIDHFEQGNIAYRIDSGSDVWFKYFHCFSSTVWLFLTLTLLCYSLIYTIYENLSGNLITILDTLWNFFVVVYSKGLPKPFETTNNFKRILIIYWVYLVLIINILFCTYLLDFMVKVIPDIVIDSWDDLFNKNDVKIITMSSSPIEKFALESNTELALNFRNRIETFELEELNEDEFFNSILLNIIKGTHVYVNTRLTLVIHLKLMAKYLGDMQLLKQVYVSKRGGGSLSYFIGATHTTDQDLIEKVNFL